MVGRSHLARRAQHRHSARPLGTGQRLLVAGALTLALLLSGALIYFRPGSAGPSPAAATPQAPALQQAPLPPGDDTYYYWGQHRPLDQQP